MVRGNIRTFTTEAGGKPVEDRIRSLAHEAQAEAMLVLELLEVHGSDLAMPHARYVEDGLWELRAHVRRVQLRILYFHWRGRTFGLLHGFTKRTAATPRADVRLALDRRSVWLAREHERERIAKGGEDDRE